MRDRPARTPNPSRPKTQALRLMDCGSSCASGCSRTSSTATFAASLAKAAANSPATHRRRAGQGLAVPGDPRWPGGWLNTGSGIPHLRLYGSVLDASRLLLVAVEAREVRTGSPHRRVIRNRYYFRLFERRTGERNPGSQVRSQQWQYSGDAKPSPATIYADERRTGRHHATFWDASEVPSMQQVAIEPRRTSA